MISYHATNDETEHYQQCNKGRPRKLKTRDINHLKNKMSSLRKFDDPKLAEKFQKLFGLESQYCMRTILKALHRMNAFHLNTRRKQTMTKSDKQLRLKSFKQCIKFADFELWVDRVSFYFDGVTFYPKYNPFNEAVQPKVKIW